jgi:hypothetical protein
MASEEMSFEAHEQLTSKASPQTLEEITLTREAFDELAALRLLNHLSSSAPEAVALVSRAACGPFPNRLPHILKPLAPGHTLSSPTRPGSDHPYF